MSVIIQTQLPLEKKLEALASSGNNDFPDRNVSYWPRYCHIKQWIADEYYQSAGAGLALHGERYTKHDISHVDDVIDMAGELLGLENGANEALPGGLTPYELYVLLFAILLHDAGNAKDRKQHEKEPKHIIAKMGLLSGLESLEQRIIASVAEAHGGRTKDGDRDTISKVITAPVVNVGRLEVRARMLAAILRLADELSEKPSRADPQAICKPYNPPESAIHNLYCKTVQPRVDCKAKAIFLDYVLSAEQLEEEFVIKRRSKKRILMVDYISDRVRKCDRERRYCNRFMHPIFYDRINITLDVYDASDNRIERIALILADEGYPDESKPLRSLNPRFDGRTLIDIHCSPAPGPTVVSMIPASVSTP